MTIKYSEGNRTTFQISPYLKYNLYENEENFRWVRRIKENGSFDDVHWIEIPKEIAVDLAHELLRIKK